MKKEIILQADKIGKYFYEPEKFKVLNDISFTVNQGEFVSLVGKSGSGKSTLLYILSTMDTTYEGNLIIHGEKITGLKQNSLAAMRNEKIGFVFQFHYLLPEFTCLKNVMIPALRLGNYSKKDIEEKAYEKLKLLGLQDQALKPSSKLSGGQQQRVAIARAIVTHPDVLLADEPTGNLDSQRSVEIMELLTDLNRTSGITVLMVTHEAEMAGFARTIVHFKDGLVERFETGARARPESA